MRLQCASPLPSPPNPFPSYPQKPIRNPSPSFSDTHERTKETRLEVEVDTVELALTEGDVEVLFRGGRRRREGQN